MQGDNKAELDFNAVQRGDAEMEQKLNRLVRGCLEYPGHQNPILSIHDQGAGGNGESIPWKTPLFFFFLFYFTDFHSLKFSGNVLKELVEPEGAVIFTRAFELGDDSVSTLDLWGAEYQESNAILCSEKDISKLEALSRRERCPVNVVGTVTGTGKVGFKIMLKSKETRPWKLIDMVIICYEDPPTKTAWLIFLVEILLLLYFTRFQVILTEEDINHEKFLDSVITDDMYPVNLDLQAVLGNVPKKVSMDAWISLMALLIFPYIISRMYVVVQKTELSETLTTIKFKIYNLS